MLICLLNYLSTLFSSSHRRRRRALSASTVEIEIREEPVVVLSGEPDITEEIMSRMTSKVIDSIVTNEFYTSWVEQNVTNGTAPLNITVQEPYENAKIALGIIHHIRILTQPAQCREQSPCTIQPKLGAYDVGDNLIHQLGSKDRPWQIEATIMNQSDVIAQGAVADYIDGSTQFTLFSLPRIGIYEVQFTLMQPNDIDRFCTLFLVFACDEPFFC